MEPARLRGMPLGLLVNVNPTRAVASAPRTPSHSTAWFDPFLKLPLASQKCYLVSQVNRPFRVGAGCDDREHKPCGKGRGPSGRGGRGAVVLRGSVDYRLHHCSCQVVYAIPPMLMATVLDIYFASRPKVSLRPFPR